MCCSTLRNKIPSLQNFNGRALPPRLEFGDSGESTTGRSSDLPPVETPSPTMGTFPSEEIKVSVLSFLKK